MVSPPGFIFSNHVPISSTSTVAIHKPYFFPYMVFEYQHNIRNQLISTAIPSLNTFHIITAKE